MIAALSANHLAALTLPSRLGRLYVAVDPDRAGRGGTERLSRRAREAGIEVFALIPTKISGASASRPSSAISAISSSLGAPCVSSARRSPTFSTPASRP